MNQILIIDKDKKFQGKYQANLNLLEKSNFDLKKMPTEDFYKNIQIKFTGFCFVEVIEDKIESQSYLKLTLRSKVLLIIV